MTGGEGHIDGAGSVGTCEGKQGVYARGVEQGEAQEGDLVKVGGGLPFLLAGEEPGGIRYCVIDIKVACEQIGVLCLQEGRLRTN